MGLFGKLSFCAKAETGNSILNSTKKTVASADLDVSIDLYHITYYSQRYEFQIPREVINCWQ
jgi:hypothetical protein